MEVLGLVRSTKNNFAPINKIPSDVFSLIPGYLKSFEEDENLITMTHVCRGWRELLIACPSLWVRLHCKNADKTRVYIDRSKSSPLELSLSAHLVTARIEAAFAMVIPHIGRLKSLVIFGPDGILQYLTPYLSSPIPLLNKLIISICCNPGASVLDTTLFNGDLSSLCSLSLAGVITNLPWKNLSKLTTFKLSRVPEDKISVTQLLDFFEDAHHLRDITLHHSIPTMSNAPPGRVVSIPHLKKLTINTDLVHSILLNHLSIPAGASLTLAMGFTGDKSPVPNFLPKTLGNLGNIFPISSVNLTLSGCEKYVRLDGPSGGLYMLGDWMDWEGVPLFTLDRRILRSFSCFDLSGTQRLTITQYKPPPVDAVYHILSRMKDLRTLTLTQCNNLPFILALNPDRNSFNCTLCPKLEELVLYIKGLEPFNIEELMSTVKERASAGTKLSSITIVGLGELTPGKKAFKLKEYVTHVDYRVVEEAPRWDDVLGDGGVDWLGG